MCESKPKGLDKNEQSLESDLKSLLLRERKLQERLQEIAVDIQSGLDPDSEERAVQLENREVLEEIARVTALELTSVRQLIADIKASQVTD